MLKVNVSKINEDPIVQLDISIFVLSQPFSDPNFFLKLRPKYG